MSVVFFLLFAFVCLQRLIELVVAKRNEQWMKSQGGYEAGASHYPLMVTLHTLFFISLLVEVVSKGFPLIPYWPILIVAFLLLQLARVWVIRSLGRFWNTKIIILPGANIVKKGPYLYIRHPNYVVVSLEILILPLIFEAYITLILFSILNAIILSIRIPAEEKALLEATNYQTVFFDR